MNRGQWVMAYRNLSRNRRRNLATGMAIGLGFAALLALGGYYNRVYNYLRAYTLYSARVGHITVYKHDGFDKFWVKPADFSLSPTDVQAIRDELGKMDGVEMQGSQLLGAGLIGNGCRSFPFVASGIEPQLDLQLHAHPDLRRWAPHLTEYVKGRGLWNFPADLGAVGVAEGLARFLHKTRVFDDFPKDHRPVLVTDCHGPNSSNLLAGDSNIQLAAGTWDGMLSALDGEVVANYNTGYVDFNNSSILLPLDRLQRLYGTDHVTFYSIWLKNQDLVPETLSVLRTKLAARGLSLDLYEWTNDDVAPMYSGTMQFVAVMMGFIAVVLTTVIVFSVFNSATMTVIERSQEIGMMRSLGYTRNQIRQLFAMEMVLLTLISIIGGGIVAVIGILGINNGNFRFSPPGTAGTVYVKIVPNLPLTLDAIFLIVALALATTWLAVRGVVRQGIAQLVAGTPR